MEQGCCTPNQVSVSSCFTTSVSYNTDAMDGSQWHQADYTIDVCTMPSFHFRGWLTNFCCVFSNRGLNSRKLQLTDRSVLKPSDRCIGQWKDILINSEQYYKIFCCHFSLRCTCEIFSLELCILKVERFSVSGLICPDIENGRKFFCRIHKELFSVRDFYRVRANNLIVAFDEVERKPNFVAWLCRVSCPV